MPEKLAVVAVGGNSLILDEGHKTVADQYKACALTCSHIADMIQNGYNVIVTHGNGPQVGFILRRSDLARKELHPVPLDSCDADTQGAIGYQIQKALFNEFAKRGMKKRAATVVTQVLVDRHDPSFKKPSKPIGSFMAKELAEQRKAEEGWEIVEDAGRGWRRVVASPIPVRIIELSAIESLVRAGFVVVAAGGGGIPVVENDDGSLDGAEAVIDKDHASSLLARNIKADVFIISTAVEKVCLDFGKPEQRSLDSMTVAQAKRYIQEGHFKPGSMLPKVKAIISFLEGGGKKAIITNPENLLKAIEGKTGTVVLP